MRQRRSVGTKTKCEDEVYTTKCRRRSVTTKCGSRYCFCAQPCRRTHAQKAASCGIPLVTASPVVRLAKYRQASACLRTSDARPSHPSAQRKAARGDTRPPIFASSRLRVKQQSCAFPCVQCIPWLNKPEQCPPKKPSCPLCLRVIKKPSTTPLSLTDCERKWSSDCI